jgi:23S rRNA (adenine2503-C2)-methyltransferase
MQLKIVETRGDDNLARVYVARLDDGSLIEFVESVQPPRPRAEKWVLILSTLKGCPVRCPICDAGGQYRGKLSADQILAQADLLVRQRFDAAEPPVSMLKVQLARMGEPALNDAVLQVLVRLRERYRLPGLVASFSTVAPRGRDRFFEQLAQIKKEHYPDGRFQMQFSLHSTDDALRRKLVPIATWSLEQIALYGERFYLPGDRKITLNFAPARTFPLDPSRLRSLFDPSIFLIKLTPINPTAAARRSGLVGLVDPDDERANQDLVESFTAWGYDVILSIGELRENQIGSNCGMYVSKARPFVDPGRIPVLQRASALAARLSGR